MSYFARAATDLSRESIKARLPEVRERLARLTPREKEVATDIVLGRTAQESGARLGITRKTVEVHRLHVLKTMGVRSSLHLARILTLAGY